VDKGVIVIEPMTAPVPETVTHSPLPVPVPPPGVPVAGAVGKAGAVDTHSQGLRLPFLRR